MTRPTARAVLLTSLTLLAAPTYAGEFQEDFERVVGLRNQGELLITNNRGDIVVEGWSQDKIRVKGRRKASAESEAEARKLFAAMDLTQRLTEGATEISAEYGRGMTLEERLQERQNPRTSMELTVLAPANRPLRIWAVNGKVTLRSWNGSRKAIVDIRSSSGPIQIENVRGGAISVNCPSCSFRLSSVEGTIRCMGGSGSVSLHEVTGPSIYVESESGAIRATRIDGEQLYVSKSGSVFVQGTRGHAEFHTHSGAFELLDGEGLASGRSASGNISIRMKRWRFSDKAIIESQRGTIDLELPRSFSGELDARSARGKVEVAIPLSRPPRVPDSSSNPVAEGNHRFGVVREGGELLRVFSEQGNVRISYGK